MSTYTYDKIPKSGPAIRILTLLPGENTDPLRCQLEICRLEDNLTYEALSYCWGTDQKESAIVCSTGSIKITKTLESALIVLRRKDQSRRLWIDQICINQGDNAEKSSQVRLMRQIYSGATRTVVWLGEDDLKQGPMVLDLFNKLKGVGAVCESRLGSGTGVSVDFSDRLDNMLDFGLAEHRRVQEDESMTHNRTGWFPTDDVLVKLGLPRRASDAWTAFSSLLQSHYFTRVWTLQEVLSSQEAVICWGPSEFPWASLRAAYRWLTLNGCLLRDPRLCQESPRLKPIEFLHLDLSWYRGQRHLNLIELVTTFYRGFDSTDPRDKIYAFISLAPDGNDLNVDYSKSEAEVFADFTRLHIQQTGDLSLLNLAGLVREDQLCLPSWVPSWSSHITYRNATADDGDSLRMKLEKPLYPLAMGDPKLLRAGLRRRPSYIMSDNNPESRAYKFDQLLIKGFPLPKDQVRTICTRLAYLGQNGTPYEYIAAHYKELCQEVATSPTLLLGFVHCMTTVEMKAQLDDNELLARFISYVFNCILKYYASIMDDRLSHLDTITRAIVGLDMIGLASDAMDSGVSETGSSSLKSSSSLDFIKGLILLIVRLNRITPEERGMLIQEGLDGLTHEGPDEAIQEYINKINKAVVNSWALERTAEFISPFRMTGSGRKLFLTTDGRVGIGPARMSPADVIIIAYGCETPYVLRPISGTQEYWLVGDCYIHGLREDGTAMPKEDDPPARWFCLGTEPTLLLSAETRLV